MQKVKLVVNLELCGFLIDCVGMHEERCAVAFRLPSPYLTVSLENLTAQHLQDLDLNDRFKGVQHCSFVEEQ